MEEVRVTLLKPFCMMPCSCSTTPPKAPMRFSCSNCTPAVASTSRISAFSSSCSTPCKSDWYSSPSAAVSLHSVTPPAFCTRLLKLSQRSVRSYKPFTTLSYKLLAMEKDFLTQKLYALCQVGLDVAVYKHNCMHTQWPLHSTRSRLPAINNYGMLDSVVCSQLW